MRRLINVTAILFFSLLLVSPLLAVDVISVEPNGRILITVEGVTMDLVEYLVPVGSIQPFAGGTDKVPPGWELCDGRSILSTDPRYARLFAVIGTSFGDGSKTGTGGSGSGNFNLPDLRGRFARGADQGAGRDPDVATRVNINGAAAVAQGGIQEDAFQGHWHQFFGNPSTNLGNMAYYGFLPYGYQSQPVTDANARYNAILNKAVRDPVPDASGALRKAAETRPDNVAVNFIIKL